jgi:hypothetical protein
MKEIEDLLERYFEGCTSAEEERKLQRFFASGQAPEKLILYTPLFAYLDAEVRQAQRDRKLRRLHADLSGNRRKLSGWISGVAACAAVLTGWLFFHPVASQCAGSKNYVIIDGRCYTDDATVRDAALKTLREISGDDSELFSENDRKNASGGTAEIIRKQLNEFNSFFGEDERSTKIQPNQ